MHNLLRNFISSNAMVSGNPFDENKCSNHSSSTDFVKHAVINGLMVKSRKNAQNVESQLEYLGN